MKTGACCHERRGTTHGWRRPVQLVKYWLAAGLAACSPAVGETVKGYEASVFYGVAGPKGMPPEVVAILNQAFTEALADPKMQKRLADLGGEPMPMTPEQFGKLTSDETDKWAKVVKAANLSIE